MEKIMLKPENKIFKNLYNDYGWEIDNAIKRDDWKETKDIISNKESDRFLKCVQNLPKLKAKDLMGLNVEVKPSVKDKSKRSKGIF